MQRQEMRGAAPDLEVLQLNLEVPLMVGVLFCQEDGVAVVPGLAQDPDRRLHVKVNLALAALCGSQRR